MSGKTKLVMRCPRCEQTYRCEADIESIRAAERGHRETCIGAS